MHRRLPLPLRLPAVVLALILLLAPGLPGALAGPAPLVESSRSAPSSLLAPGAVLDSPGRAPSAARPAADDDLGRWVLFAALGGFAIGVALCIALGALYYVGYYIY